MPNASSAARVSSSVRQCKRHESLRLLRSRKRPGCCVLQGMRHAEIQETGRRAFDCARQNTHDDSRVLVLRLLHDGFALCHGAIRGRPRSLRDHARHGGDLFCLRRGESKRPPDQEKRAATGSMASAPLEPNYRTAADAARWRELRSKPFRRSPAHPDHSARTS